MGASTEVSENRENRNPLTKFEDFSRIYFLVHAPRIPIFVTIVSNPMTVCAVEIALSI